MSGVDPVNFNDDLRVPRTPVDSNAHPIACDKVVVDGVTYYRQQVAVHGDTNKDVTATGNITTQNLNLGGAATTGSAVEIDTDNKGTVTIQVTGTYTGTLVAQVTTNGTDWITQSADNAALLRMSDGVPQSSIPSGMNDIWQVEANGHSKFRITATGVVTGTAAITVRASQGTSQVSIGNSPVDLDKYSNIVGAINTSQETTLQAYTQHQFRDDEMFDTAVSGAGASATWSASTGGVTMTVTNAGEYVIRQSKLSHQYLASAPHFWELTTVDITPVVGVVKRYGYYSSTTVAPYATALDGFCLETDDTDIWLKIYKAGTVTFEKKQSGWDDPLNGRGKSGVTLTPAAFQAVYCEFLYLGGTEADFGFLIGGKKQVPTHTFKNSNVMSGTFVASPNQPIRYEVRRNSGTGATSILQICSKVGSKGLNLQKIKTRPHLYSVGTPAVYTFQPSAIGTEYAMFGAKLNTRHGICHLGMLDITSPVADDFILRVRRNPTFGGTGTLTYNAVPDAAYSVAFAPTPAAPTVLVTAGREVYAKPVTAMANSSVVFDLDNMLVQFGQFIDGTYDEFVVTVEPQTSNLQLRGALNIESAT